MKVPKLIFLAVVVMSILLVGKATDAQANPVPTGILAQTAAQDKPIAFTGAAPGQAEKPPFTGGGGIDSLTGSNVVFDPSAGGDTCSIEGATQTFCFQAETFTPDWGYVYNLWQRFPADWTVTNVYVQGTPTCDGGGTWGGFSWAFQTAPYEVNISHARYQSSTDHCVATYCFQVTSGMGDPSALESWYWAGDDYANPPYHPCSDDNYTPGGQAACDEATLPQASVPVCNFDPGVYLLPPELEASGCNGTAQTHTFSLYNNTGSNGTFDMAYDVTSLNGTLTGPATVSADDGELMPFNVELTPDLCVPNGGEVIGTVDASGNTYTGQAVITKTIASVPDWEAIPASAPTWAGYGYPRDGCTAMNSGGDWVTYIIGDRSGISGFWGYNHDTNAWSQPAPTGLPADRWAPDWAYDPDTNLCYVTGGANIPGGGTYNTAYVFDPVANAFSALLSFTSIRDFHNSWVGTIDGTKYLCIGGGVTSAGVMVQATQCYDIVAGTWAAENATMSAYPTDPFGAADGILHDPDGDQFWYVGGMINAGGSVTDEARYWDDADNAWHQAGNTGVPRFRVEGDFFNDEFYQLGGSSGGFNPTASAVRGSFDGVNWVWTALPDLANVRMDNVVGLTPDNVWSVDGYGAVASAYVEHLTFCPECTLHGWLEGYVLDSGTMEPPCQPATVTINPGNVHASVDPTTGHYGPVSLIPFDYTAEATANGFSVGSAMVTIVDMQTTMQDFDLDRAVIEVDPTAIHVAVPAGIPGTVPLTITNLGMLPLDWEIVEVPASMAIATTPAGAYQQTPAAVGVDSFILDQIAQSTDGQVDFFIAFKQTADLSGAYNLTTKADKVAFVRAALRGAADQAQANVRAWLDRQGIAYKTFYIDNTLLVHAGQSVIDALAAFPEVSGFHGNHIYTVLPLETQSAFQLVKFTVELPGNSVNAILPWDLNIMNIPQVWDELGVTGQGVIVANVDTGVYYQHEALFDNYLCGSGPHTDCWLDPETGTTAPNDSHGHGTGTMGQMAADNNAAFAYAVGGAPDAGWIACQGCPGGSCPDTALDACADWLVMTTPNTPDIVNNSWGTWAAICDLSYQGKLQAYRAAGILPVFAAGNIGNACNTSTPPANNIEAFAIGATTPADVQAGFSSTGPGLCSGRTQFPDVSAPGESTCSTISGGGYGCGFSGTSFAAPLASGCLALMKSANPSLTIDEMEDVMMATADNKPNTDCGAPQDDPNFRYGDGRVNCFAAVSAVYNADIPWVWEDPITGTVPVYGDQVVDVTFQCTPAQIGQVLTGTLRIKHNDPCEAPVDIPLEFFCQPELTLTWEKTIDGIPWVPDMQITRETSDTIVVEDVLHLLEAPLAGSMPFVPVQIEGQAGTAALTLSSPALPLGTPERPVHPEDILWDQPLSSLNQAAYVDQDFPDFAAYSAFLADDFTNAEAWNVTTIFIPGDGWNGFTSLLNASALTWQIYADNGGIPDGDPAGGGNPPVWTLTLAPTDTQVVLSTGTPGGYPSNTTLNLALPVALPTGHWWLVFYPTLEFATGGQFGRQAADTTNGYTGQFINPGNAFGYGTDWLDWTVLGATQTDIAFRLEGSTAPPVFSLIETWNPENLDLVDWAATGGDVNVDPNGQLVWTDEIVVPTTITLTKWFHVEPCTWTETILGEAFWLNQVVLEQRPVVINKLPPVLWIDSMYDADVFAGQPVSFVLEYGNTGGYENDVMVRNDFPPEAPFVSSLPPPSRQDPDGMWAEWDTGDLAMDAQDSIEVTVQISATLEPSTTIEIWDGIFDHVGILQDAVISTLTVVPMPEADLEVAKAAPAEVTTGDTFTYTITVTNTGPDDATGVELMDTLPVSVTFVSASAGCVEAVGVVTCDVGDLAAEDSVMIYIVVMAPEVEGELVNEVEVTGNEVDPVMENNTDSATTMVVPGTLEVYLPLIMKAP